MSVIIRPRIIIIPPLVVTWKIHVGILRSKDNSFLVGVVSNRRRDIHCGHGVLTMMDVCGNSDVEH